MNLIGELAALLTSVSWSGTSVLFTKATQQVGSIIVNRIRVILGLIFLMLLNWAFYGYLLPVDAGADRWLWFALSGAIGYAMGDLFLFQSFLCIGTQSNTVKFIINIFVFKHDFGRGRPLIGHFLAESFFAEVFFP